MVRIGNLMTAVKQGYFSNKKVIIVGAGKDGKEAYKQLTECAVDVACFIDSQRKKWQKKGVKLPFEITAIEREKYCFLLCIGAISFLNDQEIRENAFMKEIGFEQINDLVILDRTKSILNLLEKYLKENDIDSTGECLNLKGMKVPNFLEMYGEGVKKVFLVECGDLLLPHIFNDFSEIDEGPYEENDFKVNVGDVVFDCGANLGLFSAIVAQRAEIVYAFEPIPKSVNLLEKTQKFYKNIVIHNIAVSDANSIVEMVNHDNLGQNRIVRAALDLEATTINVPCITLDEFVIQNNIQKVDFIKADIEGAERLLLKGAQKVLKEFAPKLALCTYHLEDDPIVLENLIKQANPNYIVQHKYKKLYAYVK